jgi:hypothetical protein
MIGRVYTSFLQGLHSVKVRRGSEDMCGFPPKEVCSRSSPSPAPCLVLKVVASLGRVCAKLMCLRGWHFLCGRWP